MVHFSIIVKTSQALTAWRSNGPKPYVYLQNIIKFKEQKNQYQNHFHGPVQSHTHCIRIAWRWFCASIKQERFVITKHGCRWLCSVHCAGIWKIILNNKIQNRSSIFRRRRQNIYSIRISSILPWIYKKKKTMC